MTWVLVIELLAKFGPQAFELIKKLIEKWGSSSPVTVADIEELRALAQQTPQSQMLAALARAGISPDSEQGKAFLALVS